MPRANFSCRRLRVSAMKLEDHQGRRVWRWLLCTVAVAVVLGVGAWLAKWEQNRFREECFTDLTALYRTEMRTVNLYVQNPDKQGQRYFQDVPGRSIATTKDKKTDVEFYEWPICFTRLARLKSGEIVCPVWLQAKPYFGWLGTVQTRPGWSCVECRLHMTRIETSIEIPDAPAVKTHFLLLRPAEGKAASESWRVMELSSEEARDEHFTIVVPALDSLPALEEHRDGDELERTMNLCVEEYSVLTSRCGAQ